jgi:pterin-4a-carbinolamine dehydratase
MWRLTFNASRKWWRVRHSKDKVKRSYAFDNFFQAICLTMFATFMFIAIAYTNL